MPSKPKKPNLKQILWNKAVKIREQLAAQFLDDDDCKEELLKYEKICCTHCNFVLTTLKPGRSTICPNCRKTTWYTASSFFKSVKRFRPYLVALHIVGNHIALSGGAFGRLAGVATSTADLILKKIALVLSKLAERKMKKKRIRANRFRDVLTKRSYSSLANKRAKQEFEERVYLKKLAQGRKQRLIKKLDSSVKQIYKIVKPTAAHFEEIMQSSKLEFSKVASGLTVLEIHRLVSRSWADFYKKENVVTAMVLRPDHDAVLPDPAIQNLVLISKIFSGISRKYLQLYLVIMWAFLDEDTWNVDKLHMAITQHRYVRREDIYRYHTPDMVSLYSA